MNKEIERKFLVKGGFIPETNNNVRIVQGYLSTKTDSSVRVRVFEDKGYLTIKGKSDPSGLVRNEWEYEIPVSDAGELLKLCSGDVIQKTRYFMEYKEHTFEVDVFEGENKGLVIVEIELENRNEVFSKPAWLGEEVTGDPKYYNIMLLKCPYKSW